MTIRKGRQPAVSSVVDGRPAYRGIPLPPGVIELPTASGMPVPYITVFLLADRDVAEPEFADTEAPGGLAVGCGCVLGEGRPDWGKQCPVRQRKAMIQRRCSVCGRRIGREAVFAASPPEILIPGGPVQRYSVEAPAHPRCMAYSALVCPRLRRQAHVVNLAFVPGPYPLLDRWQTTPRPHRYVPHGTPRPRTDAGRYPGALDLIAATLDDPRIRWMTLADWMPTGAPAPYRTLWTARGRP